MDIVLVTQWPRISPTTSEQKEAMTLQSGNLDIDFVLGLSSSFDRTASAIRLHDSDLVVL